jgi:hypothetical protein
LQERHIGEHCGVAEYFGTTKLFRRSEFEGYGDSLKTLLEQQNYSEDQNLKGFVIHSKPCIVKILNFTVDFNNKKNLQFVSLFRFN